MKAAKALHQFDPRKIAHYEIENYVAYYQKRWLRLFWISVALVKETFHLTLPQSIYGAYLIARAEMAAAPFPDNDRPLAEAFMRRFYRLLNRVHQVHLDVERMAQVEVEWWVVHRRCFGQAQNQAVVEALLNSFVLLFSLPAGQLRQAAYHRARGILYSDLWVNGGRQPDSPLLALEEEEFLLAYNALQSALAA